MPYPRRLAQMVQYHVTLALLLDREEQHFFAYKVPKFVFRNKAFLELHPKFEKVMCPAQKA